MSYKIERKNFVYSYDRNSVQPSNHKKMDIINLTPHAIHDITSGRTFPPSGTVARVATKATEDIVVDGNIQMYHTSYGKVEGIEDLTTGDAETLYIVSAMAKEAIRREGLPLRVCSPGEQVRDENGQPKGCRGFYW